MENYCTCQVTKLFLTECENLTQTYQVEFEIKSAHRQPRNLFPSRRKKSGNHYAITEIVDCRWFVLGNHDTVESKPLGTGLHYEQGTIDITAKSNDSGNLQA